MVGSSTIPLPPVTADAELKFGGQTLTALPGGITGAPVGFEIGHQTLLPGAKPITVAGTTYSINNAGSLLVEGKNGKETTVPLATGTLAVGKGEMKGDEILTAAGEIFIALLGGEVVVGGSTISVGGKAVTEAGGKTVSLGSQGVVVGGKTFAFATPTMRYGRGWRGENGNGNGTSGVASVGATNGSGGPTAAPTLLGGTGTGESHSGAGIVRVDGRWGWRVWAVGVEVWVAMMGAWVV